MGVEEVEAQEPEPAESDSAPKIVAFFCNWCTYAGADLAGSSRIEYPANIRVVRVPCSGRIRPEFILTAFHRGADGVLVSGCHPGDCHYAEGNYYARRRLALLRPLMELTGIDPRRFRCEWISASEGRRVAEVVREMVQDLTAWKEEAGSNQPQTTVTSAQEMSR